VRHAPPRLAVVAATAGLAAGLVAAPALSSAAAPTPAPAPSKPQAAAAGSDSLPNPLESKRDALKQKALQEVLAGKLKVEQRGASVVAKVGDVSTPASTDGRGKTQAGSHASQYVELARKTTDRIFVVLVDFGNTRHPDYPDQDTDPNTPGPALFDGPLNNHIPQPDRSVDNSTVWQPNYDRQHYQDLYFGHGGAPGTGGAQETVRDWYNRQSSGQYDIDGTVTDWVKVKYNEARYGRSNGYPCSGNVCSNTWYLVQDGVNAWVKSQLAAGRSLADVKAQLKTFDQWDRYDADGDGNFNEPDGYIDHFQIVHAGGDQADGDPQYGEDAVWSHRWYVQTTPIGGGGPGGLGGTQIGNTGLWVGDYTIQPENGGMSVFTHEYGHDLGLPDLYDTNGGENSVNYWSMMAQSRVSARTDQAIGTRGADLGAWEKLELGWLDYELALPSQNRSLALGPHEFHSARAQAVVVPLPKKKVTQNLVPPASGSKDWWSGSGDDLNNAMSRSVTLAAGTSTLSMQANWDIEDCGPDPCDYAYVEVDSGSGYTAIPGSITDPDEGNGIDGTSNGWKPATFDLSDYAGQTVSLRIRYATDGAAGGKGFFADDISLVSGGSTVFSSGAEASPEGWTLSGFSSVGATITKDYANYYIASYRSYNSFDRYLRTGPYNFGSTQHPDYVQHFPYQDGLLISYWDLSQSDNNTSVHPGSGLILPIDSHPRPLVRIDGALWRPRVGGYDAPFGTHTNDSFTLSVADQPSYVRGLPAVTLFSDDKSYWDASQPTASVKVPTNGVYIRVMGQQADGMTIRVGQR
jgi:immune inhibitor A